eukprot:7550455-Pyramimonas_sp.AAC.1
MGPSLAATRRPNSNVWAGALCSSAGALASLPRLFGIASERQRPLDLTSSAERALVSRSCDAPPCRRP